MRLHSRKALTKLAVILAALGLSTVPAHSAPPEPAITPATDQPDRVSRQDFLDDIAILRRVLETVHPGLYRYTSPADFAARCAALEAAAPDSLTLAQAFLELSRFTASLKCGHTYPNYFNQSDAVANALFKHPNRVPFEFTWLGEGDAARMIVTVNRSRNKALTPGSQIHSINALAPADILREMMTIARADGSNDAKRRAFLEVRGRDIYEAFDIYLPMMFPRQVPTDASPLRIEFTPYGSSERLTASLEPLTFDQRRATATDGAPKSRADEPLWSFAISDDSIATLRMPTWAVYNSKWDWRAWINDRLDELSAAKPAALVVDLRGNEGGLDCGDPILARLITAPLATPQTQRLTRYRMLPTDLNQYLNTWDDSFRNWGDDAVPTSTPALVASAGQEFFELRQDGRTDATAVEPRAPRYTGKAFVLVDSTCSSATFQFAQRIKLANLGTVVGQPTGGNQRGINGGAFFFLTLPKTRIQIDVPIIARYASPETPDAGITPDIIVATTPDTIASGADAEMNAVRAAIGAKQRD